MAKIRDIPWWKADQLIDDLGTDEKHDIRIQREAIPLVFVPGIMGTRLRKTGTRGKEKKEEGGLPNLRWDPSSPAWMVMKFGRKPPSVRKSMLIGESFKSNYLEVANDEPVEDGFSGIMEDYWKKFLNTEVLKKRKWGPVSKIFEFPVYAVGYNWTDDAKEAGIILAKRIKGIIEEAKAVTGICEKVILITHSMGGLVARWAVEKAKAKPDVLGIIHAVQPVTGSPAAYYRVKAGFEAQKFGDRVESWVLGHSGRHVTPILGNMPGGLQLLPNKHHSTSVKDKTLERPGRSWLMVTEGGSIKLSLPKQDPYHEIYAVPAEVRPRAGEKPSTNKYWGLIDPDLLDPKDLTKNTTRPLTAKEKNSQLDAQEPANGGKSPWSQYVTQLKKAETFHDDLLTSDMFDGRTYCIVGTDHPTPDVMELRIEQPDRKDAEKDVYEKREFRGQLTDASGKLLHAVLQAPSGPGDGTVPISSAGALDAYTKEVETKHQPAFQDDDVQKATLQAIMSLCAERIRDKRRGGAKKSSSTHPPPGSGAPSRPDSASPDGRGSSYKGGGGSFGGGGAGGSY